jgi:hypothetical protein
MEKTAGDSARAKELWKNAARYPVDAALAAKVNTALAKP